MPQMPFLWLFFFGNLRISEALSSSANLMTCEHVPFSVSQEAIYSKLTDLSALSGLCFLPCTAISSARTMILLSFLPERNYSICTGPFMQPGSLLIFKVWAIYRRQEPRWWGRIVIVVKKNTFRIKIAAHVCQTFMC